MIDITLFSIFDKVKRAEIRSPTTNAPFKHRQTCSNNGWEPMQTDLDKKKRI
jgi:hypothetical protein